MVTSFFPKAYYLFEKRSDANSGYIVNLVVTFPKLFVPLPPKNIYISIYVRIISFRPAI